MMPTAAPGMVAITRDQNRFPLRFGFVNSAEIRCTQFLKKSDDSGRRTEVKVPHQKHSLVLSVLLSKAVSNDRRKNRDEDSKDHGQSKLGIFRFLCYNLSLNIFFSIVTDKYHNVFLINIEYNPF